MKFVADSMLGKLAKWLRVLGLDTHYQSLYGPGQLQELVAQERILITRKRKTSEQYPGAILIYSDHIGEQLEQLKEEGYIPTHPKLFTICLRCNTPLKEVSTEMARPFVPEYVLFNEAGKIKHCPLCRRFYWPGSHRTRMESQLRTWGFFSNTCERGH